MPLIATTRGELWIEHLPSADRPLILIHGAGGLHSDWSEALRARGAALDLPGHGDSPGQAKSTVAEYAEDVIALLDALNLERAIFAGHSLGGAIALALALEQPARVSGLILVATGAKLAVHPDILDNLQSNLEAAALRLSGWFWTDAVDPALRQAQHTRLLATLPGVLLADFSAANGFDARGRLGEIQAPALIVCGDADVMTPPKFSRYLHEQIAGSRLAIIPNAGHMLPLEQPDALDAAIDGWLAGLP